MILDDIEALASQLRPVVEDDAPQASDAGPSDAGPSEPGPSEPPSPMMPAARRQRRGGERS